jgi:hypothetical protein
MRLFEKVRWYTGVVTVRLRMIEPWVNPRSRFLWFRRRVPKEHRKFGMPAEIKFSLETTDRDEAVLRCQEENLRLQRQWRAVPVGTPPDDLSHLQIAALAGEFYAETVATHRDEPGPEAVWEDNLRAVANVKSRRVLPRKAWLNIAYGEEARSFLKRKGIRLIGERFEKFLRAYVDAKVHASGVLLENARNNYIGDKEAARYPKFETPKPEQQFDDLWSKFGDAKKVSPRARSRSPNFAGSSTAQAPAT